MFLRFDCGKVALNIPASTMDVLKQGTAAYLYNQGFVKSAATRDAKDVEIFNESCRVRFGMDRDVMLADGSSFLEPPPPRTHKRLKANTAKAKSTDPATAPTAAAPTAASFASSFDSPSSDTASVIDDSASVINDSASVVDTAWALDYLHTGAVAAGAGALAKNRRAPLHRIDGLKRKSAKELKAAMRAMANTTDCVVRV